MAFSAFRCCRSKHRRARSRNAGPAARITSATSKGRPAHAVLRRPVAVERKRVQRAGGGLQMAVRKVQVHGGRLQVAVAEQKLNGAQIDAGFEQVRGERMPQRVRVGPAWLCRPGARPARRRTRPPLLLIGCFQVAVPPACGKQPRSWFVLQPAPILAEGVEQPGAEHDVAVLAALAAGNVDRHAPGVDIADIEAGPTRRAAGPVA